MSGKLFSACKAGLVAAGLLAVSAAALAQQATREFEYVDTNDDVRVSSSEYEVYARKLYDEMDGNADDKLTSAEIMASEAKFNRYVFTTGNLLGPAELSTPERIQRLDANQDGNVSQGEHADAAAAKFKKLDTNNNGELSVQEFDALHAKPPEPAPPPPES